MSLFSFVLLASMQLSIPELEVDGAKLENVSCELESGGVFAPVLVATAVRGVWDRLEACESEPVKRTVSWTWKGSKTESVVDNLESEEATCLQSALQLMVPPVEGSCRAVLNLSAGPAPEPESAPEPEEEPAPAPEPEKPEPPTFPEGINEK